MGTSIIQDISRRQAAIQQPRSTAGALITNLYAGQDYSVPELSEADELARMLAMPREMVLGDITSARAKAQAMRADRLATQAPVTAQWAGKTPERTAISQPSWDGLTKIERIFGRREALEPRSGIEMPGRELLQPTRPISRGIVSATISKSLLNSDLNRMYYNTTWDGRKTPEFKRKEKEILDQIGAIQAPEAEGALETMFESAAQFTGSRITGSAAGASVAGVAAVGALAIGAPVAAVAGTAFGLGTLVRGIAEQSGADIRANSSVPKADPVVADLSGRFSGLVSGSIDYLATKYVAGIFGSAAKKVVGNATAKILQSPSTRQALINGVKAWGSSIGVETLTETIQQAISLASEQVVRSSADAPAIELERVGRELFETALTTAAGMLILGVPGGAVTTIADLGKVESAKERQAFMSALGDEVKATSLSTTFPAELKSFADEVVQMYGPVQNILIPIERFKAYWQEQNVDPRVVAGEIVPDIAAYDEAVSTGGDLVIPLANYVASVAPTEHHAKLMEDVRFRPGDITYREAKEMEAKVAEDIEGLRNDIDEAIKETPTEESAKRVLDAITEQISSAGVYTPDQVATQAKVAAGFWIGTARRAKMDPWQLYQSRNIKILGPVQAERLYDAIAEMENELAADPTSPAAQEAIKRVEEIRAEVEQMPGGAEVTQRALTPMVMPISAVDVGQRVVLEDSRSAVVTGRADGNVTVRIAGGETRTIAGDREVQVPGAVLRQARVAFVEQPVVPETVDTVSNVDAAFNFAGSRQFGTNRDFKVALQDRVKAAAAEAGVDLTQFVTEVEKYLVRMGVADARTALRTNANAVGWYNEKVTKALRVMSLVHPELATDPNARFAFVWAMAVTSNGLKVDKNFEIANNVYTRFKQDGVMPTDVGIGNATEAINESMHLYNSLVEQYGLPRVIEFFTSLHTVKEVQRFTGKNVSGENLTTEVFGAAALGPKIGNGFFMNLYGQFGQLTMDRWFMRTWGRWTGTLVIDYSRNVKVKQSQMDSLLKLLSDAERAQLQEIIGIDLASATMDEIGKTIAKVSTSSDVREQISMLFPIGDNATLSDRLTEILGKPKAGKVRASVGNEIRKVGNALAKYLDGQKEAPSGAPERGRIRQVMRQVLAELRVEYPALTMADLQALLWYPEKRLYDAAKTSDEEAMVGYEDDDAPDYANAAVKLALAQNVPQSDITNTLTEVDNELKAAAVPAADVVAGRAERGAGDGVLRPATGEQAAAPTAPAQPGVVGPQILRQSVSVSDESVSRLLDRAADPDYVFVELPETIEVDGVQRPTRNNKGQQISRNAKGVQNFWRWFGDSKLVDAQGRPIVIYHGTNAEADFGEFRINPSELGTHVGTTEQANRFAEGIARVSGDAGGRVFPLYARLQNPLRLMDRGGFTGKKVIDQLRRLDLITEKEVDEIALTKGEFFLRLRTDKQIDEGVMRWLKGKGYDGVVYLNRYEGYTRKEGKNPRFKETDDTFPDDAWRKTFPSAADSYIVFTPQQLKSTSNIGSFSRVKNILRQDAYHGSPYTFDRFSLANVGTGEGFARFGWGINLTLRQKTAARYRDVVSDMLGVDRDKAALYTVEVSDAVVAKMLEWEKPLSQQSEAVQSSVRKMMDSDAFRGAQRDMVDPSTGEKLVKDYQIGEAVRQKVLKNWDSVTGEDLYRFSMVERGVVESDEVASKLLLEFGVTGIKHRLVSSESDADTFVVFDENLVTITERNGQPVAARERADVLSQAQNLGGAREPAFDTRGEPSPVSRNVADATAIFGEGRFSVVTGLEETMRRKFFGTKATTPNEVAAGMSALARGADERFDVLLTDAKGKPISIVSGSKGGIDFASVPLNSVVFDIVRTPGAVNAWFVHNHPTGFVGLSREDKSISEQLANLLQGSGVAPKGIMAVGLQSDGTVEYEHLGVESTTPTRAVADIPAKQKSVPFFERQIQQRTPVLSPPILGLEDVLNAAKAVAGDRDGLLMLNTKGEAVGFVELAEGDVKKLRYSPEMRKIQEGAALVNANYYVVIASGWGSRELNNIQRFVNAFNPGNLSLYDVIDPDTRTSARQDKQLLETTDTVFRQAQQARPNAFIMPGVSRTTIGLMRTANLSSLMHEFSHDYLNLLFDVADMPEATEEIRADAALVLKYFGVEEPSQITSEHQEKWARMFESYLMEGKAPSKELQSAFGRFRVWLNAIYRAVTSALVPVSPEIRGVFDRMLASDEQIAEAVQQDELGPLFESASEAGMSEAEFKAYREAVAARDENAKRTLMVRLVEEQNKERRQFWKDREAEVRQTVTEQVAMEPIQQVVHFLKTGTLLSGEALPEDATPYKLSKALLVSRYGPDLVKGIPRGTYSVEGGVDPDVVALAFGFDSGDAMISQMQAFEPRQARIDRIVKETMAQEFPDLLNDSPALAEAAQDAVHQAPSDQLLYAELVKLGKLDAMIPPTNLFAVRQAAKEIVAKTRIRDLVPDRFRRAEAKAGRLAYQAMRQGDKVKAAFHKRQQLLNHLLYREATASIELTNKAYKFFGKMAKGPYQQRLGKAGREYLEQMNALLDQYDFSRISGVEAERRMALSEWAAAQVARGIPVEIPASVLYATQRTNYRLLTVEQLQGVYDTGRQIYHVARNEGKLLAAAEKASFEEVVESVVAGIGEQHKIEPREPDYAPSRLKAAANWLKKADAWHVKPEFLFRWLDGDESFGPVHQALFEPIAQAENAESEMVIEANKRIEALFNLIPKDRRKEYLSRRIQVPGVSIRMTGGTALAMALNWGNTSNREALLEGTIAGRPVFTPQQIDAVLRTLTKAEWDFVQGVWDYINEFWPQIAELQRSLTGVAPEKVEAEAFTVTTADGETVNLRGGYYPLAYDQNYNWAQFKQDMAADVKDIGGNSYTRAATRHGFTEARVGSGGRPVKLDLSVFSEHVLNVIHDLTHRKAIMDVQKLAENAEVREAIEGTAGRELYRTIRPWLIRIAGDRLPPASPMESLVGRARTGVTVVNMGLKVTTAIVQPIGYLQSVEMLGANYARRGLTAFFANPAKLAALVKEQSVAIRTRQQSFDRDVRDQTKRMLKKGPLARAQESFFFFTGLMDMSVAIPTWYGAYLKSLETLRPGDHHAAVTYADSVVRMTQGSGAAKDLAQIQGGGELARSFTLFYTYFNALYNLLRRSGALLKDRGPRDTGRFLASMAVLWFLPAVLSELIAGRGPDEEEEEDAMQWALWKIARYPFSTVVGLRDAAAAIGPEAYKYELSPVVSAGRSVIESINAIGKAAGEAYRGDGFELTEGEIKQFIMAIGYWGQLPSRQMWITGSYLYDWMMGYEEPESPSEAFEGLAFPRQK